LSEVWSAVTKAGIAEAVLALTKLDEDRRSSLDCLQTPSVWLTLAALCLLQDEHVERLSSTQWARGAVNKVNHLSLTSVHVSEFFFYRLVAA
jgi:E3 ubiquitin-protein ligase MYCBP2